LIADIPVAPFAMAKEMTTLTAALLVFCFTVVVKIVCDP